MTGYITRYKYVFIRLLTLFVALQLLAFPVMAHADGIPTSSCNSYMLADATSGDILFANKPDESIYPASITKIMTALVLLENVDDLSKTVTVGAELDSLASDSSVMGLSKGEIISYEDLLYGLMLPSGGDAAVTIAVNIGGSIEGFADMMNNRAEQIGMTGTHFVNPHGLHDDNHYSTASDIAKLTAVALNNSIFCTVVASSSHTTQATNKHPDGLSFSNTNKLVSEKSSNADYFYQNAIGVKTGYTDAAKGCLVAAAQKDGQTYIAVILGDDSTVGDERMVKRFTDAVIFFEYGFTQRRIDVYDKIKSTQLNAILPGESEDTGLTAILKTTSIILWMDETIADALTSEDTVLEVTYAFDDPTIESPQPSEDAKASVGTVTYSYQGMDLFTCEVVKTPVEGGMDEETAALLRLISMILLSLAVLLLIVLILHRITRTRSRQKRKYQSANNDRTQKGKSRLRDPHDY